MEISRTSHHLAAVGIALGTLLLAGCTTLPGGNYAVSQQTAPSQSTPPVEPESSPASDQRSDWPAWVLSDCTPSSQMDPGPQARYRKSPVIRANWFPDGLRTLVVFRLEVTPQGELGRVAYLPADTDPRIVKAITQSLKSWKFKPGMRQGQAVTSCVEQPYELIFPPHPEPAASDSAP
ncbi:MAG: energy transducer TonB [Comamonas sp.]|jgi:hypothetical protein|nr:energy transducer TonB [Comamonas sp.]